LHEDVPDHLEPFLRQWIYKALLRGGGQLLSLQLEIPKAQEAASSIELAARALASAQTCDLLRIVNSILMKGGPWPKSTAKSAVAQMREDLVIVLKSASSVWQVGPDRAGLVRRIDETAADAAEKAAQAADDSPRAGSAGKQLRPAWQAIYGLEPEPEQAYRDAVKAVESAAHAIVEPNNARATLGSMRGELRAHPDRWMLAIPGGDGSGDIAPLLAMIGLLWDGQEWRHGGQTPTRDATTEEAEMAVHLAATLVNWFVSGAVRRRP